MTEGSAPPLVTVLAGGVGAARFLLGLREVVDPQRICAVTNVGDDFQLHGLSICPDLDTVAYTLGGLVNPETGWGREGETWEVLTELKRLGGQGWFALGDRDLALHLYRTQRLSEGARLSEVTAELVQRLGVGITLLPVSDDPVRTKLLLADANHAGNPTEQATEIDFQEYFVARRHGTPISGVRFHGADTAAPAPGVLAALEEAEAVVIAPSNPFVSIGPLLAVDGVADRLRARRDRVVAVSPIVAGGSIKGPAGRMMSELGHDPSAVGVARIYRDLAGWLVIDEVDAALAGAVRDEGIEPVVTDTMMNRPGVAADLARRVLEAAGLTAVTTGNQAGAHQ